jgi:hypothetical protein
MPLRYSDVTPRDTYMNRRRFLKSGSLAIGAIAGSAVGRAETKIGNYTKSTFSTDEKPTPYQGVTTYNNYYEFGTGKDEPVKNAKNYRTSPWQVSIEGEVAKSKTLDLDAVMKLAPLEERIYRHRCVEGWSFVIPWIGFPLNALLKQVEPTAKAKYVAFQSCYDPKQMISSREARIDFPYVEGLRLDEAMHPLTLISVGLYGKTTTYYLEHCVAGSVWLLFERKSAGRSSDAQSGDGRAAWLRRFRRAYPDADVQRIRSSRKPLRGYESSQVPLRHDKILAECLDESPAVPAGASSAA